MNQEDEEIDMLEERDEEVDQFRMILSLTYQQGK